MIPYLFSSALWATLIALDFFLAKKLYVLYKKDCDVRKLMFTIGLLMCTPIYASAIIGTDFSPLVGNIFEWSAFPILFAFLFTLLNDRFNFDLKRCYKFFLIGIATTFFLFFLAPKDAAMPFLIGGTIFAIVLGVVQYSRKFDLAAVTLFLSIPIFAVCLIGIYLNLVEVALTAGFAAKTVLFLAFEIPKTQTTQSSSLVVLKKKLVVAEENFAKLFNILPDPAVIVDSKGTFIALTESVSTLSGFQKEELLGTNFMSSHLITASSKAILLKNLAKRMLGFHIEPYEIELRHKNGKLVMQFELNAMKIEYEGKPADMVVFRDLTERKKLLKSIEEEQKRFQSIAESSGEWIWEVDSEGKYGYSNSNVEKILGYTAEEIIGKKCCNLICQEEREEKKKIFEDCANNSEQISITKTCQHKNGKEVIIESHISPRTTTEGKFDGFRGVDRDITERKKTEQEIENNKKYLENILNSMLSGIVIIDERTHQIIDANPLALEMMNCTLEEAQGKVCHQFFCPAEIGKCPITDLGLTVDKSEKILLRKNGNRTAILKSVGKIKSNGRSLLIENFIDISKRKEMEERLLKSERLAAIGELATMVAHDLRNPLQGIAASIHFIKKATEQNRTEKMDIVLQRIQDSIRYSEKIIRDLLDYSANLNIEYDESNPHLLVQQSLRGIVIPAGIEVVDLTQENPKLHVDIEGIKRVIVNLVTNAIEAMPEGGTVTISSKENQEKVELSFADTGSGIPMEKIDKLWTPFVTTKAKGMGLGLPICKRIVEGHKGEIHVETENGKGTTFTIIIPIKAPEKENIEFIVKAPTPIFLKTS